MLSVLTFVQSLVANAEESDTVSYHNQTVEGLTYVISSNAMIVSNVTVAPTGQLTLTANSSITINPSFNVQIGGVLNIMAGESPRIQYSYDASGNRTRREIIED